MEIAFWVMVGSWCVMTYNWWVAFRANKKLYGDFDKMRDEKYKYENLYNEYKRWFVADEKTLKLYRDKFGWIKE